MPSPSVTHDRRIRRGLKCTDPLADWAAGGADALVTMLKSNARHHRDGAVYAIAGLMDRNVDAVRHAFAHSQGAVFTETPDHNDDRAHACVMSLRMRVS